MSRIACALPTRIRSRHWSQTANTTGANYRHGSRIEHQAIISCTRRRIFTRRFALLVWFQSRCVHRACACGASHRCGLLNQEAATQIDTAWGWYQRHYTAMSPAEKKALSRWRGCISQTVLATLQHPIPRRLGHGQVGRLPKSDESTAHSAQSRHRDGPSCPSTRRASFVLSAHDLGRAYGRYTARSSSARVFRFGYYGRAGWQTARRERGLVSRQSFRRWRRISRQRTRSCLTTHCVG